MSTNIEKEIRKAMDILCIERMPTTTELRKIKISGLEQRITRSGGFYYWAEKLGLETKKKKWDNDIIEKEILRIKNDININHMPTREQVLLDKMGNSLSSAICRTGGFRGWAKKLNLEFKDCESKDGWAYEDKVFDLLINQGYKIKKMTTGYPYDLLINNKIKIDVKMSRPHYVNDKRYHTFGINKIYSTCDLYILVALNDLDDIEKILIIPGYILRVVTLTISQNNKYDKYINRWDLIEQYNNFYNNIIK